MTSTTTTSYRMATSFDVRVDLNLVPTRSGETKRASLNLDMYDETWHGNIFRNTGLFRWESNWIPWSPYTVDQTVESSVIWDSLTHVTAL